MYDSTVKACTEAMDAVQSKNPSQQVDSPQFVFTLPDSLFMEQVPAALRWDGICSRRGAYHVSDRVQQQAAIIDCQLW